MTTSSKTLASPEAVAAALKARHYLADDSLATRREVLEQGLTLLHKPVRPLALKSILDRLLAARAAAKAPVE